jgi:hypothetical protein
MFRAPLGQVRVVLTFAQAQAPAAAVLVRLSARTGTAWQPVPGACCTTCVFSDTDPVLSITRAATETAITFQQSKMVCELLRGVG